MKLIFFMIRLNIDILDKDLIGGDDLIGGTSIDLEDRCVECDPLPVPQLLSYVLCGIFTDGSIAAGRCTARKT